MLSVYRIASDTVGVGDCEADDFTVTESGHVVFWIGGKKVAVIGPHTYNTIRRLDNAEANQPTNQAREAVERGRAEAQETSDRIRCICAEKYGAKE